jgi:hypothetical protein
MVYFFFVAVFLVSFFGSFFAVPHPFLPHAIAHPPPFYLILVDSFITLIFNFVKDFQRLIRCAEWGFPLPFSGLRLLSGPGAAQEGP